MSILQHDFQVVVNYEEFIQLVAHGWQVAALLRLVHKMSYQRGLACQFGVGAIPGTTYALQRADGAGWTTIATGNGTTLGATRNNANFPRNATTQYRIVVNGTGEIVHSGIALQRDNLNTITAIAGVG